MDSQIPKKVSFHTLGCRLNFSESSDIMGLFMKNGYEVVPFQKKADVVFINTCTVTDRADATCRNIIRKAKRTSPHAKVVVAGCYAQMASSELAEFDEVDLILGNSQKHKVLEYLSSQTEKVQIDQDREFAPARTEFAQGQTRAFLKIQDGCNYICSFCIIPQARGRSRSIKINQALHQAHELVSGGFKEIVLTGVNIGEFGKDTKESLYDLLKGLEQMKDLPRIRLSSIEPNTLSHDMIRLMSQSSRFLPHFHIPLQSGDDNVLKSMRRRYDTQFYEELISHLKDSFPNATFGADVLVGHPGETSSQFNNTVAFVKKCGISHLHVFPFSSRQGTFSAALSDKVAPVEKKSRVAELIELGNDLYQEQLRKNMNREEEVLVENANSGYTRNFLKVKLEGEYTPNQIVRGCIGRIENGEAIFIEKTLS